MLYLALCYLAIALLGTCLPSPGLSREARTLLGHFARVDWIEAERDRRRLCKLEGERTFALHNPATHPPEPIGAIRAGTLFPAEVAVQGRHVRPLCVYQYRAPGRTAPEAWAIWVDVGTRHEVDRCPVARMVRMSDRAA